MLGFFPRKPSLYKEAFLPRSATHLQSFSGKIHNERLEYLGDAVLDSIVADYLFRKFPQGNEGFMSQVRARIVKRKYLDYLAVQLGIPALIPASVLSASNSKHLFGNTLEALIGAIYMDRGYRLARKFFIKRILAKHVNLAKIVNKDPDYKSRIIEWAQKKRIEVLFNTEEEHPKNSSHAFVANIYLDHEKKGTGRGGSKKEAEQQAAKQALSVIRTP